MNVALERLRKRRAALIAANRELVDVARKAERDLSADEDTAFQANDTELQKLAASIAREERLVELEREAAAAYTPPGQPSDQCHIEAKGPAFRDDPKVGFKSPREFMLSVMDASMKGHTSDQRLLFLRADESLKRQATVGSDEAGTYSDPYGGFLVPQAFSPNLLSTIAEADPIGGRVTQIPMTAPSVKIPARVDKTHTSSVSGGFRVYRRAETEDVAASRQSFEMVTLNATPLMGISYATEELLTDSPISFAALIEQGFRTEFASKLINERINGTGVGQMTGVINSACILSVAKEVGQAADTIVYQNIVKMRSRCWNYSNAVWMYNADCLPTLATMFMPIGTSGVPMWISSAREGEPDMLWGRPAFPTEYLPTVGDTGDILLGDWSQFLEGTYQQVVGAESIHVRFLYNERTFRFTMRNDGAPWWSGVLTPKNGSTLSPFVKLDARA